MKKYQLDENKNKKTVAGCGLRKKKRCGFKERGIMKSYKDLEIYRISYALATKIHKMSLKV